MGPRPGGWRDPDTRLFNRRCSRGKRRRGVGRRKPRRGACWHAWRWAAWKRGVCLWQESLAGPPAGLSPRPAVLPACLLEICPGKAACSPGQVRSRSRRRCCCRRCHSRPGLPAVPWLLFEEPAVGGVAGNPPHLHDTCARPPASPRSGCIRAERCSGRRYCAPSSIEGASEPLRGKAARWLLPASREGLESG